MEEELIRFDKYIEYLKESIIEYDKKLNGRNYQIILANGEVIFLTFTQNILAHLLGVQYPYLKKQSLFKGMTSYSALTFICNNPEIIKEEIRNGNLKMDLMFSKMLERKNMSIIRAPYLNSNILNKIVFACKYNEHISIKNSDKNPLQSEYIVGMHNDEGDMTVLGMIKEEESNYFKINSNLLVPNNKDYFDELKTMIGYQTLTYPVSATVYRQSSYSSEPQLVYLNEESKLNKIELLEYYCVKLGTNIDSTADTKRQLKEVTKEKEYKKETLEILKIVSNALSVGECIDLAEYKDLDNYRLSLLLNINNIINRLNIAEATLQPILQATENYEKNKINSIKMK